MKKLILLFFFVHTLLGYWWSTPQNLGISGADDINPQACRVQLMSNSSCLVWQTNLHGNWDIYSRFSEWAIWGDTMKITDDSANDMNPSVAYDYARNCYWCAWQRFDTNDWNIYIANGDQNGWSTPYLLTDSILEDYLPSVYVIHDTVWAVWSRGMSMGDSGSFYDVYSCFYDGTQWSSLIPLTDDSTLINFRPKINSRYNHPIVVWERGDEFSQHDIYYSEYLSGTWQLPQPITTDLGHDCNPEVTSEVDPDCNDTYGTWVVWQSDRDGNYEIYSTGYDTFNVCHRLTFCDSADIVPNPLFFDAVTQDNGPTCTAFSTNRDGNADIYTHFAYWGGADTIVPVDTDPADDISPVMTGGNMYIWVLWQTDRNTDWDIYGSYIFVGGVEESNACDFKAAANLIINPNPFREITNLKLQIPSTKSQTSLKIYDATGKTVKNFSLPTVYSLLPATIFWDGTDNSGFRLPDGVYFVRLRNQAETLTEKVVLIK
jgi:hypothetical protein